MKVKFKSMLIAVAFICLCQVLNAQPGGGGGDPDPSPHGVPLDLGISALIAAGIGYAAKKKYDARKKEKISGELDK